jgi:serine protease Do
MRRFTIVTVALTSVVSFLVGLILAGEFTPAPIVSTAPRLPISPALARPASLPGSVGLVNFADVAERVNPSVVNIDATSRGNAGREVPRSRRDQDGTPDGPTAPRDFDTPRQGSGSGFIIAPDGYILTNYHVIDAAERIGVTLADGRSFRAGVVGTDPAIDVALLKIEGARDLPAAALGNSDDLRVGEWVCAIGNPLGYVHSVTAGVVSFIGRKLFDASLDDYIQTDAAINFGNSGGPLINARGEVIGINSAISSKASNIGFAVPINQAVGILPQLKTRGRVSRGYMGVFLTDVTPALQRSLNLAVSHGALVQEVNTGSPAERAGVRAYDVITEVEGRDIDGNDTLIRDISARLPGSVARLGVVRDGRAIVVPVKLAERPAKAGDGDGAVLPNALGRRAPESAPGVPLGLTVRDLDRASIGRPDIPDSIEGIYVSKVDPTGAGFSVPVRRGFVILEINRKVVRSVAEYQRIVSAARRGDVLALYCYDPGLGQRVLVTVTVE